MPQVPAQEKRYQQGPERQTQAQANPASQKPARGQGALDHPGSRLRKSESTEAPRALLMLTSYPRSASPSASCSRTCVRRAARRRAARWSGLLDTLAGLSDAFSKDRARSWPSSGLASRLVRDARSITSRRSRTQHINCGQRVKVRDSSGFFGNPADDEHPGTPESGRIQSHKPFI